MEKSGYIDVDALQAQTTLEAAAQKCGVRLDLKPADALLVGGRGPAAALTRLLRE